jgi:membrane protein DedA with SNARE-associated domain
MQPIKECSDLKDILTSLFALSATIAQALFSLGYPGVLIALMIEGAGIPFPGDAFLVFYGFAAAEGKMHFALVWMIAIIGYLIGTTSVFLLCRSLGDQLIEQLGKYNLMSPRNVRQATGMMNRYSLLVLAPGRLLPGIRAIGSYAAGISHIDFSRFLLYTSIGAAMWSLLWISVGFWFGENMSIVMHTVQTSFVYITLGILLIIAGFWFIRRRFYRA